MTTNRTGEVAVDEQTGSVVWVLLVLCTAAALALSVLRWVPPGHRIVATRRGVVSRVAGPGLFLRVPVADQVEVLSAGPEELPLAVRATSRDGTDVRLLATALVRRRSPEPAEPYADPWAAASQAAEQVLADLIERTDVCDLSGALDGSWKGLVSAADGATRPWGVEVHDLELVELDALLTHLTGRGPD